MIRRATADDAAALADLAALTFPLACPSHTPPEAIAEHIATELSAQRFAEQMGEAEFYVDEDAGTALGYIMLAFGAPPIEADWQRPIELRRIYAAPQAHGSGVAADLMATALQRAAEGGHDWIWLGTNEENKRALRFYEKCGFRIVGERTFRVAQSVECDYVLARTVEP